MPCRHGGIRTRCSNSRRGFQEAHARRTKICRLLAAGPRHSVRKARRSPHGHMPHSEAQDWQVPANLHQRSLGLESWRSQDFAQRLQAGLEHIYLKKKQATSGKKLAPAVARIIKLLSKEGLAEVPNASEQGKEDLQNLSPEQVSKLYEKFGVDTVPELAASSSSQLVPIEVCSSQEILASQASAAPPDVTTSSTLVRTPWPSFDSFLTAPKQLPP